LLKSNSSVQILTKQWQKLAISGHVICKGSGVFAKNI
jgi:hypothetical protein